MTLDLAAISGTMIEGESLAVHVPGASCIPAGPKAG